MDLPLPPSFGLLNWLTQPKNHMVQVYVITVDGQKLLCIGPLVHEPKHPDNAYIVEGVEFGECVTAREAIRLLDGSLLADVERQ